MKRPEVIDAMKTITKHYLDGACVESHGREVMDTINPSNGKAIVGEKIMRDGAESRPRQMQAQAAQLDLTKPRRGKNRNALFTPPGSDLGRSRTICLPRVVSRLPCPEVIEERRRMAGEIHDTLAQQFAGILLHLEAASSLDNAEQQDISECVTRAKELARYGLEDSRRMLLGLRPKPLEGIQLCDALELLAENFWRDCGIECSFCLRGRTYKLSDPAENELYRVAQEALCNVRKHSGARSVSILLRYGSGGVLLAIKDNGYGFVGKKSQIGVRGFGMLAMSDRALRLGGKVDINSRAGAGTEVKLTLPVHRRI
jgi:signal transduction histidine kinase